MDRRLNRDSGGYDGDSRVSVSVEVSWIKHASAHEVSQSKERFGDIDDLVGFVPEVKDVNGSKRVSFSAMSV